MDRRCDECKWWEHYDNGRVHTRVGLCKRHPPTAIEFDHPHPNDERSRRGKALWPILRDSDWCGEFAKEE